MSVSTFVKGVRDLSKDFTRMKAVKDACDKGGVSYPKEVIEFFKPVIKEFGELKGVEDNLIEQAMCEVKIDMVGHIEYGGGATIDLSKIPKDVTKLRIFQE